MNGHISVALLELGSIALRRREYARARALLEESVTINRADGKRTNVAVAIHELAVIDVAEADLTGAKAHFEESIAIAREVESGILPRRRSSRPCGRPACARRSRPGRRLAG